MQWNVLIYVYFSTSCWWRSWHKQPNTLQSDERKGLIWHRLSIWNSVHQSSSRQGECQRWLICSSYCGKLPTNITWSTKTNSVSTTNTNRNSTAGKIHQSTSTLIFTDSKKPKHDQIESRRARVSDFFLVCFFIKPKSMIILLALNELTCKPTQFHRMWNVSTTKNENHKRGFHLHNYPNNSLPIFNVGLSVLFIFMQQAIQKLWGIR